MAQRALATKGQCTKLEFIGLEMYQVIAKYLEVDGVPCVVEMISCLDDETLLDAEGREVLIKKFAHYRRELYADALTGSYNRRYFEDRLKEQRMDAGIAMIDLDDLKTYNDTYGHMAGDKVLMTVAEAIISCIRKTDRLVRYGGDEFLLVMPGIGLEAFIAKLHRIQDVVRNTSVEGCPQLKLSVSIGGALTNGETVGKAMYRYVSGEDLQEHDCDRERWTADTGGDRGSRAAQCEPLPHSDRGRFGDEPQDSLRNAERRIRDSGGGKWRGVSRHAGSL